MVRPRSSHRTDGSCCNLGTGDIDHVGLGRGLPVVVGGRSTNREDLAWFEHYCVAVDGVPVGGSLANRCDRAGATSRDPVHRLARSGVEDPVIGPREEPIVVVAQRQPGRVVTCQRKG